MLLQNFIASLTVVLPFYPVGTMERVVKEGQVATANTYAQVRVCVCVAVSAYWFIALLAACLFCLCLSVCLSRGHHGGALTSMAVWHFIGGLLTLPPGVIRREMMPTHTPTHTQTTKQMFSNLPSCGRPTRLLIYDLHTLQVR